MAVGLQQIGADGITVNAVDALKKSKRTSIFSRGNGYSVSSVTGTIAAALAANSTVFAMRLDPGAAVNAYINHIDIHWTTIVAFTVPLTAGRRLALYRGSGAATSGGTSLPTAAQKDSATATSEFNVANGGDIRIATTGLLTVTGITYETQEIATMSLTQAGAAGAFFEQEWDKYSTPQGEGILLRPGQLLAIRNPVAMDAAGTWQLMVTVDWQEQAVAEYA